MYKKLSQVSVSVFASCLAMQALSFPGTSGINAYSTNTSESNLMTVIGHKEQTQAPIIDMNSRMLFEAYGNNSGLQNKIPAFEKLFEQAISRIDWQYDQGYLPISQYTFSIPDFDVVVEVFSVPKEITSIGSWNGEFAMVYGRARLSYTGNTNKTVSVPIWGTGMTAINNNAKACLAAGCNIFVSSGSRHAFDFAISSERLTGPSNGSHDLKPHEVVEISGTYDAAKSQLITFWEAELAGLPTMVFPQNEANAVHLSNAMKTAAVQFNIVRDYNQLDGADLDNKNRQIKIGENGYDFVYDHDAQGMLASAIEIGLLEQNEAEELLRNLPAKRGTHDYLDALSKLLWSIAKFAQKYDANASLITDLTFRQPFKGGDVSLSASEWIHSVMEQKLANDGLLISSSTLDATGRSSVDNFSALLGLKSYEYLCRKASNTSEENWAKSEYTKLHANLTGRLLSLVSQKPESEKYLSASIEGLSENIPFNGSVGFSNANAYSHFFFGRMYELFLLGGDLSEISGLIDNTLDVGLSMVDKPELYFNQNQWNGNFGRYGSHFTTSGYNASYAEGFLLGEGKYRSSFYDAFNFLMTMQSGPYSWFESVGEANDQGVDINGVRTSAGFGHGSAPHMWSSLSQARLMLTTLISQAYNEQLWLGRGVPDSWLEKAHFGVNHYRLKNGQKFSYVMEKNSATKQFEFSFSGNVPADIMISLPAFTQFSPVIMNYSGQPANYRNLVEVVDVDADGVNEIRIRSTFPSASKVKFSLQPKEDFIGSANRFRLKVTDPGTSDLLNLQAAHTENRNADGSIDVAVLDLDSNGVNLWHTAMWIAEPLTAHPGYFRIKNYHTGQYLHAEESGGRVEAASINTTNQGGTPLSGWYSAHWSIDFANGEAQIRNRHRQAYLVVNSARQLGYSSTPQNGWLLDKVNQ